MHCGRPRRRSPSPMTDERYGRYGDRLRVRLTVTVNVDRWRDAYGEHSAAAIRDNIRDSADEAMRDWYRGSGAVEEVE